MDPNKKFIDFKLITFFRIGILVLALLMFFAPWTGSIETSGMGGLYSGPAPRLYKSGFDYLIGCEPVMNYDEFIQVPIVALYLVFLLISLMLAIKPKKEFILGSIGFHLASLLSIYLWIADTRFQEIIQYSGIYITNIIHIIISLVVINIILTIVTWLFCDLDESKLLDSASDA